MPKKPLKKQVKSNQKATTPESKTKKLLSALKKIDSEVQATTVDALEDIPFWLSSGDDVLDIYMSNRKHGGVPGGRITSLDGLQQSSKSLVCSHLIKSCQDLGGYSILFDTENASSKQFMSAIGVNPQDVLIYRGLNLVQSIFSIIQQALYTIRLQMPNVPLLIIIDSLTACITQKDLQNTQYENKGFLAGLRAKMIGQALRKLTPMIATQNAALVITSQVRAKMDLVNKYMDPYVASSGGMALPFYTTLQVRLQKKSRLKDKINGVEQIVGVRTKARIDKSRLGPSYRQCEFSIRYDSGILNYTNWLQTLKKFSAIQGKGTIAQPYTIQYNGQILNIRKDFQGHMRQDPILREKVYNRMADLLILTYKKTEDVQGRSLVEQTDEMIQSQVGDDV